MADIIHRIAIKAPIARVYTALSTIEGLAGWWTKETYGVSKVGGTIEFRFRSPKGDLLGSMDMEVLTLKSNKQVRWRCKDGPKEWIGTDITFTLVREGNYTVVLFGHKNWRKTVEFMAHCTTKWAIFLMSLKELIETGKGKPSSRDVKIDNWN